MPPVTELLHSHSVILAAMLSFKQFHNDIYWDYFFTTIFSIKKKKIKNQDILTWTSEAGHVFLYDMHLDWIMVLYVY